MKERWEARRRHGGKGMLGRNESCVEVHHRKQLSLEDSIISQSIHVGMVKEESMMWDRQDASDALEIRDPKRA